MDIDVSTNVLVFQTVMVKNLYNCTPQYESEGRGRKTIDASDLWYAVVESQIETGTPYICYKDAATIKSNQKNLGTKSSNLCTEIIEYTSKDEFAVCNLASIGLSKFVDTEKNVFNYEKLYKVVKVITKNLNKIIDINFPLKTEKSNKRHRPCRYRCSRFG